MHPGLVDAALCPQGTARDGSRLLEPAQASPPGAAHHLMDVPFNRQRAYDTWVKYMHDLWQHRLVGAWLWVRAPAVLPRWALMACPAAVRQYTPKPRACAEAGRPASHQLVLQPPAVTCFSTTAQQPQPLLCLGFQIHVSCSISKTKHQSPLTLLVFKTSFDICMWGCIFPGGCTEKL